MSNETLITVCRGCGLPIGDEDIAAAVMVRVWVPRLNQYQDNGPFHGDCGKRHNMQAQATPKTPNVQDQGRAASCPSPGSQG